MSHLIAAIHEAAVSKKALRTLVILGLYFSSTVLLDEAFRVRDGLTYFGIAGAGVSLLGAAWWKVAEWRRGANPQTQWQTELRRRIRKHGGETR